MDLVDRYVQEVARRIPRKQREDVARELRSSLEDSLENRTGVPIDQVSEESAIDFLFEFGQPSEVAASYRTGPDSLIGPAHYPTFIATMRIGLAVVGGLIALGVLLDVVGSSGGAAELGRIGAQAISDIQTGLLCLLGLVVLIFAIIERKGMPRRLARNDWHPRDLPPLLSDAEEVDRTGTLVRLVLGITALLLINLSPDWLRIRVWSNGDQYSVPLLGPGLRTDVIILDIYLILSIAIGAIVLVQQRWRLHTRIADVVTSASLVFLLTRLWTHTRLLLPAKTDLLDAGWPTDQATHFAEVADGVLSPLLWWVLLAAIVLATWVTIRKTIAAARAAPTRRS